VRLLDAPNLARVVPHLAPETLHQLILHAGLEACGEVVASMTPDQLTSVLDFDLWRSPRPGLDEQFEADRFGDWLELLSETGGPVAARIIAAQDEHLVIAGLSQYVRVFDPSALDVPAPSDDEPFDMEVTPSGSYECEVGGYLVRALRADAWDAIVALLLALDNDYHDFFHAVMGGCRRLSNSVPEIDGLDDLLMEGEQLLHELKVGREQRQSLQGYITRADARAFLQMARERRCRRPDGAPAPNPIAAAYFRDTGDTAASTDHDASRLPWRDTEAARTGRESMDAVAGLLAEAGLLPQRPRALLAGARPEQTRLTRIRPLMDYLHEKHDTGYLARNRELAFLANTLMAGCSIQSRSFTPQEASDAAVGICNLGLEHWPARWPGNDSSDAACFRDSDAGPPCDFLLHYNLVTAFEVGWAVLHEDVCLFAAKQIILALTNVRRADAAVDQELRTLRIELGRHLGAGTPWRARDALDVIAMLDMPVWSSILGLISECPVLPAALTAVLDRRTGAVSATAFEFISTISQIATVREFISRLPRALRG
jgi:hypothetical protein